MYTLAAYESMLADDVRVRAYLGAIDRVVRSGDVALEIGTGVGYFAVAACRAGASHVYAIETNDAVRLGPAVAAANACADRITFIQCSSERVELPRRADVLIEDLRGVLALSGQSPRRAARRARPVAGAWRPERAGVRYDVGCSVRGARGVSEGRPGARLRPHGIDVGILRRFSVNNWYRVRAHAADLLAPAARWASLDLTVPLVRATPTARPRG